MSFDTTAGTRGARQPAGLVFRWGNKVMASRIRRKGGAKFLGFNALVLTTVGRKSGVERTTPVGWFPGPDGTWLIVASAAGRRAIRPGTTTSLPIPTKSRSTSRAAR